MENFDKAILAEKIARGRLKKDVEWAFLTSDDPEFLEFQKQYVVKYPLTDEKVLMSPGKKELIRLYCEAGWQLSKPLFMWLIEQDDKDALERAAPNLVLDAEEEIALLEFSQEAFVLYADGMLLRDETLALIKEKYPELMKKVYQNDGPTHNTPFASLANML